MNAKALFSLYLYFFITYFITFFRTSQSQPRGNATAETFFRLFSTEKHVKCCVGNKNMENRRKNVKKINNYKVSEKKYKPFFDSVHGSSVRTVKLL